MAMSKNRWIALALAAGALLRVVYFFSSRDLPFFDFPITDALFHHRLATAIASGDLWDGHAYFRAPLYYYLLGGLYAIFGPHVVVGKILGHLAGLVTGAVIIAWSDRLWGRRGAVCAALLWLGSGLLLFYEGELLVDSVFTCLLFASLFVQSESRGRTLFLLGSGALFGLAAITRPTALACLPLCLYGCSSGTRRVRQAALWFGAMAIPVAVVAGLNTWALGRPTGIATGGGINFYIGNHRGADGSSAALPEPWGYAWTYRALSDYASEQRGRPLDAGEVSDYFYDEGWRFIREEPAAAARLWIRKAVLSAGRLCLSNNLNLNFVIEHLSILQWLAVWVAWLCVLAAAGLPWLRRSPAEARWLWWFVASYGAVLVVYFTNDRFRLPLVPALLVLAAGAPALWLQATRKERLRALLPAGLAALLVLPNWYGVSEPQALAYFNLGNVALRRGWAEEARRWYDSAAVTQPDLRQLRLNRGWALLRTGDRLQARADFEAEARAYPYDARPFNNLAALNLLEGDTAAAWIATDSGLARDSSLGLLYLQRLHLAQDRGDTVMLKRDLAAARRRTAAWPVWTYWEAELAVLRGRPGEARQLYRTYEASHLWPSLDLEELAYQGPNPAEIAYKIGLTFLEQRDVDSAETWFARAAVADSGFAEAWSNWGTAAVARGDFESAVARYRQALASRPQSPVFLTNLAWAQLALGQPDSAQASLAQALAFDSTFAPALSLLRQITEPR
jgi:Flp pilus assembly protein TadD